MQWKSGSVSRPFWPSCRHGNELRHVTCTNFRCRSRDLGLVPVVRKLPFVPGSDFVYVDVNLSCLFNSLVMQLTLSSKTNLNMLIKRI